MQLLPQILQKVRWIVILLKASIRSPVQIGALLSLANSVIPIEQREQALPRMPHFCFPTIVNYHIHDVFQVFLCPQNFPFRGTNQL